MMVKSYNAAADIDVLSTDFPIPGFGLVPINAIVIKGPEPILVDTGAAVTSKDFMQALRSVIDPAELRWLWLTHTDFDHMGCLHQLLAENPRLRLITTFLGVGIMSLIDPLPMDRVHLLNPGEKLTVGNRTLTALRPPVFDNPSTTGFYDDKSGVLFSSDCFGALLQAVPETAAEISDTDLRDGQVFWASIDSPWLHKVERGVFAGELDAIRKMSPKMILSSHLPPAPGHMTERLLASLAAAPGAKPFVGPNQAALEQMLAGMTTTK
jgi:flavorubredoxin